jgi:DNA-binding NarL/FixJ family response regulator
LLRTTIRESQDLRLVAEEASGPAAVSTARQGHPDHILFAADGVSETGIALLGELRKASPQSRITVCTDQLDHEMLTAVEQVPVDGILAWTDVTVETVHATLAATGQGVRATSAPVLDALLHPIPETGDIPALTETERAVFRCHEEGLDTAAIAKELHLDKRRVQRAWKAFRDKLGAGDDYELGKIVRARRLRPDTVVVSRRDKKLTPKRH